MTDHTRTEKTGGNFIFIFVVFQVERETVMTDSMKRLPTYKKKKGVQKEETKI